MASERGAVADLDHFTAVFHTAVPSKLALSLCPGDFGSIPAWKRVVFGNVAGDLGRDTEADFAAAHLAERANTAAAVFFVGLAAFAASDFGEWPRQIAIPLQGVHRQIEMAVNKQHDRFRV